MILRTLGARVCGYSLPMAEKNMYDLLNLDDVHSVSGDVTDLSALKDSMKAFDPDVIIHMAAQPLVLRSYEDPAGTYSTNVMGTVNVLESARCCSDVKTIINVTTDKVYRNTERSEAYSEDDILDGNDPYANSKSCSELVTSTYKRAFFDDVGVPVSTCRAGNVIGGGDYANNRIVPDCVRAAVSKDIIKIRNPNSIRPYQHVMEPVCAYLQIAAEQARDRSLAGPYNIGPDDEGCVTNQTLVELFCGYWGDVGWESFSRDNAPHESKILRLDCSKIKNKLGWSPKWGIEDAVENSVQWYKGQNEGLDVNEITEDQIRKYLD